MTCHRRLSAGLCSALPLLISPPVVPWRSRILQCSGRRPDGPVHPGDRDGAAESWGHQGGIYWGQRAHAHKKMLFYLHSKHQTSSIIYFHPDETETSLILWTPAHHSCPSQEFSEEDYLAIVNGWREKLGRSNSGDQRWGLFYATRDWIEKIIKEEKKGILPLSLFPGCCCLCLIYLLFVFCLLGGRDDLLKINIWKGIVHCLINKKIIVISHTEEPFMCWVSN